MVVTLMLHGVPSYMSLMDLALYFNQVFETDEIGSFKAREVDDDSRRAVALDFSSGFDAMSAQEILNGYKFVTADGKNHKLSAKVVKEPAAETSTSLARYERPHSPVIPGQKAVAYYNDGDLADQYLNEDLKTLKQRLKKLKKERKIMKAQRKLDKELKKKRKEAKKLGKKAIEPGPSSSHQLKGLGDEDMSKAIKKRKRSVSSSSSSSSSSSDSSKKRSKSRQRSLSSNSSGRQSRKRERRSPLRKSPRRESSHKSPPRKETRKSPRKSPYRRQSRWEHRSPSRTKSSNKSPPRKSLVRYTSPHSRRSPSPYKSRRSPSPYKSRRSPSPYKLAKYRHSPSRKSPYSRRSPPRSRYSPSTKLYGDYKGRNSPKRILPGYDKSDSRDMVRVYRHHLHPSDEPSTSKLGIRPSDRMIKCYDASYDGRSRAKIIELETGPEPLDTGDDKIWKDVDDVLLDAKKSDEKSNSSNDEKDEDGDSSPTPPGRINLVISMNIIKSTNSRETSDKTSDDTKNKDGTKVRNSEQIKVKAEDGEIIEIQSDSDDNNRNAAEKRFQERPSIRTNSKFIVPILQLLKQMKLHSKKNEDAIRGKLIFVIKKKIRDRLKEVMKDITKILPSAEVCKLYRAHYSKEQDKEFIDTTLKDLENGQYKDFLVDFEEKQRNYKWKDTTAYNEKIRGSGLIQIIQLLRNNQLRNGNVNGVPKNNKMEKYKNGAPKKSKSKKAKWKDENKNNEKENNKDRKRKQTDDANNREINTVTSITVKEERVNGTKESETVCVQNIKQEKEVNDALKVSEVECVNNIKQESQAKDPANASAVEHAKNIKVENQVNVTKDNEIDNVKVETPVNNVSKETEVERPKNIKSEGQGNDGPKEIEKDCPKNIKVEDKANDAPKDKECVKNVKQETQVNNVSKPSEVESVKNIKLEDHANNKKESEINSVKNIKVEDKVDPKEKEKDIVNVPKNNDIECLNRVKVEENQVNEVPISIDLDDDDEDVAIQKKIEEDVVVLEKTFPVIDISDSEDDCVFQSEKPAPSNTGSSTSLATPGVLTVSDTTTKNGDKTDNATIEGAGSSVESSTRKADQATSVDAAAANSVKVETTEVEECMENIEDYLNLITETIDVN